MPELYEPCSHHNRFKSPTGNCISCGGVKFTPVGVTTKQLKRLVDLERALSGDAFPGCKAILEEALAKCQKQLERLK